MLKQVQHDVSAWTFASPREACYCAHMNPDSPKGERIAKYLARCGVASRRGAEALIGEGRVSVNGRTIDSPALNVGEDDVVLLNGQPVEAPAASRLWLYHKPAGLMTTHKDPQGRPTVFDALPKEMGRVISIGRLDLSSEGLLLLTNDGDLARHLELPATGWRRRYRVRVYRTPGPKTIAQLAKGVTIDGMTYQPAEVVVETTGASNVWLQVTLTEGKNREIRKLMEHFDHPVSRLIRVGFGSFQLGNLGPGEVKEVSAKVVREQLGGWKK